MLNAGSGGQLITWDDDFCHSLINLGYSVLRYDYRDTGLSAVYDQPYSVLELAYDMKDLLKRYNVEWAHVIGFSMGGQLAQLAAAAFPDHVKSLVLIGTSSTFEISRAAFAGTPIPNPPLSAPQVDYITWNAQQKPSLPYQLIDHYVERWRRLHNNASPFDKVYFTQKGHLYTQRGIQHPAHNKHRDAMALSAQHHTKAPARITCPTLIVQGLHDPLYGPDHGHDLHRKIKGSELHVLETMGHALGPQQLASLLPIIHGFIQRHFSNMSRD